MRDSIYKNYSPEDAPKNVEFEPSYWFIFKGEHLLIKTNGKVSIPFVSSLDDLNLTAIRTLYMGLLNNKPCYSVEVEHETEAPEGMVFSNLISLYDFLDEDIYLIAGKAVQIINWDKNHQFCGRCGSPTITSNYERAKICTICGFKSYTRISPAVITSIIKDGKILMAKHGYREGRYGLIAGFVEPGETLKEAVIRETQEEVGIKVKNIKYFGSQPWPYPHSMMIAFTAEYKSGKITVDEKEITSAEWFSPDEIPRIPSKMSIAGDLIEWFISNF
ncbi:MAG TPA: NAD(+) diphosphatase [Methanobacterium sp.]|nr:NAD(+) diphosphatase [Methanobacterium sp.]